MGGHGKQRRGSMHFLQSASAHPRTGFHPSHRQGSPCRSFDLLSMSPVHPVTHVPGRAAPSRSRRLRRPSEARPDGGVRNALSITVRTPTRFRSISWFHERETITPCGEGLRNDWRARSSSAARLKPDRTPERCSRGHRRAPLPGACVCRHRHRLDAFCVSDRQSFDFLRGRCSTMSRISSRPNGIRTPSEYTSLQGSFSRNSIICMECCLNDGHSNGYFIPILEIL